MSDEDVYKRQCLSCKTTTMNVNQYVKLIVGLCSNCLLYTSLLRQIFVALSHLAARVMGKNALALGADFLCPNRMGNLGGEHLDFCLLYTSRCV